MSPLNFSVVAFIALLGHSLVLTNASTVSGQWESKEPSAEPAPTTAGLAVEIGTVEGKTFFTSDNNNHSTNGMNFMEALQYCREQQLYPATVTNSAQNELLATYSAENRPLWLPATDYGTKGSFRWIRNGEISTFADWSRGNPIPGFRGAEVNCLSLHGGQIGGSWTNTLCSEQWRPLCEYP